MAHDTNASLDNLTFTEYEDSSYNVKTNLEKILLPEKLQLFGSEIQFSRKMITKISERYNVFQWESQTTSDFWNYGFI